MGKTRWIAATVASISALIAVGVTPPAVADDVSTASARAYAISASLYGDLPDVPPTPLAETAAPEPDETDSTLIPIDAAPLVVNGTFIAKSAAHVASDLPSELTVATQDVAGPYNARGIGQIEGLQALFNGEVPVLSAAVLRAEAVGVCNAGTVSYSANSEVIDLVIGDSRELNGPLNDLVEQIVAALEPFAQVVDVQLNVVNVTASGASVDALVLKLLPTAGDNDPTGQGEAGESFVEVTLGHAEVANVACAPAPPPPTDPTVLANNPMPEAEPLARTGGPNLAGVAAVLGAGGLALYALRRRIA